MSTLDSQLTEAVTCHPLTGDSSQNIHSPIGSSLDNVIAVKCDHSGQALEKDLTSCESGNHNTVVEFDDNDDSPCKREWNIEVNPQRFWPKTRPDFKEFFKSSKDVNSNIIQINTGDKVEEKKKQHSNKSASDGSGIDTSHEDTCSYSTFKRSTDESDCTVIEGRNLTDSIPFQPGPTLCFSAKDVAISILKKRKRHMSVSDNENTPKRGNFPFNPMYSGNDQVMSPIVGNKVTENQKPYAIIPSPLQTPVISSKFNFNIDTQNIVSSTPIIHSEKDKLKAKKSILKFDRIKSDVSSFDGLSDFSGFSHYPSDVKHVEQLLNEITAICEEGLKQENEQALKKPEPDKEKMSKIDIEELIGDIDEFIGDVRSEFDLTVVDEVNEEEKNNKEETVIYQGKGDKLCIKKEEDKGTPGVNSSENIACDTDDKSVEPNKGVAESVSDGRNDKTLTPESVASVSLVKCDDKIVIDLITEDDDYPVVNLFVDIEPSQSDNYEDKSYENRKKTHGNATENKRDKVTEPSKKAESLPAATSVIATERNAGRFKDVEVSVNVVESSADNDAGEETKDILGLDEYMDELVNITIGDIQSIVIDLPEELLDCNIKTNVKVADPQNLKPSEAESNVKESIKPKSKRSTLKLPKGVVNCQLDQTLCTWDEDSKLLKNVKKRWKLDTALDPETNLTVAMTHRKKNAGPLGPVPGCLEGNKVCCLELYEHLWDDTMSGTPAKVHQAKNRPLSINQTIDRLHAQLRLLDAMRYNRLRELRLQMDRDIDMIKDRHKLELQKLKHRQDGEVCRLRQRHDMMSFVLQNSILQLSQDHRLQQERMKAHHKAVYRHLFEVWKEKLDIAESDYATRAVMLHDQILQVEATAKSKKDGFDTSYSKGTKHHYGPPVMVTLRKAPGQDTKGEQFTVSVYLPARVAQAVSLEDDIYDHFYTHP